MLTVFIMRIPTLDVVDVADILDWLFMAIFPHYALGMGFSNFYINKLDKDFCDKSFATVNLTPGVLCPFLKNANIIHPCCPGKCTAIYKFVSLIECWITLYIECLITLYIIL